MRALDWIVNAVSYIHMYRDGTTVGNYPLLTRQSRALRPVFPAALPALILPWMAAPRRVISSCMALCPGLWGSNGDLRGVCRREVYVLLQMLVTTPASPVEYRPEVHPSCWIPFIVHFLSPEFRLLLGLFPFPPPRLSFHCDRSDLHIAHHASHVLLPSCSSRRSLEFCTL
jgi:hypothetical protein